MAEAPIEIEAFFDCSCVWVYLAREHVRRFADATGVPVRWRPVLAEELFETVNPAARTPLSRVKQAYYARDLVQWADYLERPLAAAASSPADTAACMLACIAASRWDRLERFADAALDAAWAHGEDLGDRAVIARLWAEAGLPPVLFNECLAWPEVAMELQRNTRDLMARGGFGTPTFFVGDDMYFGNDAIPLLERAVTLRLRAAGLGS